MLFFNYKQKIGAVLNDFLDLILPNKCICCNKFNPQLACSPCLAKLPFKVKINYEINHIEKSISLIEYTDSVRTIIEYIKFHNSKDLAKLLGDQIPLLFTEVPFSEVDYWVSVPLHRNKLKKRGFNQTEIIFQNFLNQFNIEFSCLIERTKYTEPLFNMNKLQRKKTLSNVFSIAPNVEIKDKIIVLMDDILTSGSTLTEIASLLKQHGAKQIFALTYCYVNLSNA